MERVIWRRLDSKASMRKIIFENGEFYHIYNRGVDKRIIFLEPSDYQKFFDNLKKLQKTGFIYLQQREAIGMEIYAYCFNPNHFHLLVRQTKGDGITKTMHRLSTSYTMYFNKKYHRSGSLFEAEFKAIHVHSDPYFHWVTAYINANAEVHQLTKNALNYPWCSLSEYAGSANGLLKKDSIEFVLRQYPNLRVFQRETKQRAEIMKEKKTAKKFCME